MTLAPGMGPLTYKMSKEFIALNRQVQGYITEMKEQRRYEKSCPTPNSAKLLTFLSGQLP